MALMYLKRDRTILWKKEQGSARTLSAKRNFGYVTNSTTKDAGLRRDGRDCTKSYRKNNRASPIVQRLAYFYKNLSRAPPEGPGAGIKMAMLFEIAEI